MMWGRVPDSETLRAVPHVRFQRLRRVNALFLRLGQATPSCLEKFMESAITDWHFCESAWPDPILETPTVKTFGRDRNACFLCLEQEWRLARSPFSNIDMACQNLTRSKGNAEKASRWSISTIACLRQMGLDCSLFAFRTACRSISCGRVGVVSTARSL